MGEIIQWSSEKYPPVGRCIYGHDHDGPFTDEHIIPFGLLPKGGDWYLSNASCGACADITKRFEEMCLRSTLGLVREQLGLKTRRKKNRGKPVTLLVRKPDGNVDQFSDTAAKLPKSCLSFRWHPPGLLRSGAPTETNFDGEIVLQYDKESFENFAGHDGQGVRVGQIRMLDYARMLAKIAHSYAYAKCGPDTFDPALPDLILGKNEFAPYFIGGDARGTPPAQPSVLHDVYPMTITIGEGGPKYLSVVIQLFACWNTLRYVVIVGKQLKDINLPTQRQP
jgi:hypothetical protein